MLLAPALVLAAIFVVAFALYCGLCAVGRRPVVHDIKHNVLFGRFFASFLIWLIGPLERRLGGRVSPNAMTALSLLGCAATGVAAGLGSLPVAVWLYAFAGIFDVLDGRLARYGTPTAAGALLDSVSDRWGELFVFTGYAWYLRDSPWLFAVLGALGGSMMVSYTRARAEALGIQLAIGLMQRAERIVLVAGGTLIAAWLDTDDILGATMVVCGIASCATAIHRGVVAYRALVPRSPALEVVVPARAFKPAVVRKQAQAQSNTAITGA